MSLDHSVSCWINSLKDGDQAAARELWNRFFVRLVDFARKQLGPNRGRVVDEEDIALSVFFRLCEGVARNQFQQLTDRDDLWSLLVTMTRRRLVDLHRVQTALKRGGEHQSCDYSHILTDTPTPDEIVMMAEQHQRLLQRLDDDILRTVAIRKMEGATDAELARELGLTERSIRRKMMIIRESWSTEIST